MALGDFGLNADGRQNELPVSLPNMPRSTSTDRRREGKDEGSIHVHFTMHPALWEPTGKHASFCGGGAAGWAQGLVRAERALYHWATSVIH